MNTVFFFFCVIWNTDPKVYGSQRINYYFLAFTFPYVCETVPFQNDAKFIKTTTKWPSNKLYQNNIHTLCLYVKQFSVNFNDSIRQFSLPQKSPHSDDALVAQSNVTPAWHRATKRPRRGVIGWVDCYQTLLPSMPPQSAHHTWRQVGLREIVMLASAHEMIRMRSRRPFQLSGVCVSVCVCMMVVMRTGRAGVINAMRENPPRSETEQQQQQQAMFGGWRWWRWDVVTFGRGDEWRAGVDGKGTARDKNNGATWKALDRTDWRGRDGGR